MSLRDLDDRLVPRLAVLLRRGLDRTAALGRAVSRTGQQRGEALLTGDGPLRRLDDRFASRGPLRLLRDVPQLGVLLIAALFLAGTASALSLRGPESVRVRQAAEQEASLPLSLGPAVGTEIDPYLAAARERVVELNRRSPQDRYLALVSLNRGLTPQDVGDLLEESGLEVVQAYLRAPIPFDSEQIVFQTPDDVVTGLRQVFAATAERKAREQQELLSTARTIQAGTPEEEAFRRLYEADARIAGQEAAAYRTGCACVFALVVQAPARDLAELLALPVVRGVEAAPRGAELTELDVRPLSPDEQGVVAPPATRQPVDGQ